MKHKINCDFDIREVDSVVTQIYNTLKGEECCELDKNKIFEIYKLTPSNVESEDNFKKINEVVLQANYAQTEQINNLCIQLKQRWDDYHNEYVGAIEDVLKVNISENFMNTKCQLHLLPINEIDFEKQTIYLDCNKDINELFKIYIIMTTKLLLVNCWPELQNCNFYSSYKPQNKVWLFTEIAIDAIFANSNLSKLCSKPSYKYFYSLKIDGVNFMEQFRKLQKLINTRDFFTAVYMFVHEQYYKLLKFKNYLY